MPRASKAYRSLNRGTDLRPSVARRLHARGIIRHLQVVLPVITRSSLHLTLDNETVDAATILKELVKTGRRRMPRKLWDGRSYLVQASPRVSRQAVRRRTSPMKQDYGSQLALSWAQAVHWGSRTLISLEPLATSCASTRSSCEVQCMVALLDSMPRCLCHEEEQGNDGEADETLECSVWLALPARLRSSVLSSNVPTSRTSKARNVVLGTRQ